MRDEPRRHRTFMVLLGLAAVGSVPVWFVGTAPRFWLGLPAWLWSSVAATVVLSALIAWGVLRYWHDDDD